MRGVGRGGLLGGPRPQGRWGIVEIVTQLPVRVGHLGGVRVGFDAEPAAQPVIQFGPVGLLRDLGHLRGRVRRGGVLRGVVDALCHGALLLRPVGSASASADDTGRVTPGPMGDVAER